MMHIVSLLVTFLVTFTEAIPIRQATDTYTVYMGDGSVANGWPSMDKWVEFQVMFDTNAEIIKHACAHLNPALSTYETTDPEIASLYNAIVSTSKETTIDPRFILAIMMQESNGCVRVYTTNNGVDNPGLMQSHVGTHTCNANTAVNPVANQNLIKSPCSYEDIVGMIRDGVEGTQASMGLAQVMGEMRGRLQTGDVARVHYAAARKYNSGSVEPSRLEDAFSSTKCYVSDVANRLTGWLHAANGCWVV